MACSELERRWRFDLEKSGNLSSMTVIDELIDTEAIAKERAMSEFLKNGYASPRITFKTHLTEFNINDIISLGGLPYLVKNISIAITKVDMVCSITAVRYE